MESKRMRKIKQIKLRPASNINAIFVLFRKPSHHFGRLVHNARLKALTAVLMKNQVFWGVFRNKQPQDCLILKIRALLYSKCH
jgi:hypothetical protein